MNRPITVRVLRCDLRSEQQVIDAINALLDPILVPPPRRRPLLYSALAAFVTFGITLVRPVDPS